MKFNGRMTWFLPLVASWSFDGRFIFAPALVRSRDAPNALSVGGWSLGGFVALQYDAPPAGLAPYLEVVEMGALCARNGRIGQWGRELFVSTSEAEQACKDIWGVPARHCQITFDEEGPLSLTRSKDGFQLSGWSKVRSGGSWRSPAVPVLWTPEIKALWAPIPVPTPATPRSLKLHDLRLSGTSLRVLRLKCEGALGLALAVDGLRIDIDEAKGLF